MPIIFGRSKCYLCSRTWIDHVLIPYLSRELHEALLLGAGRHRPQGRPQACMGPASWGIVGRNMYFCTVMYRSLSLDYQYQSTTFTDIMLKSTYYSRINAQCFLVPTYYAQNYASIIRPGLQLAWGRTGWFGAMYAHFHGNIELLRAHVLLRMCNYSLRDYPRPWYWMLII